MKEISLNVEVEANGVKTKKIKVYRAVNFSRILRMVREDFDFESFTRFKETGCVEEIGFYRDGTSMAIGTVTNA